MSGNTALSHVSTNIIRIVPAPFEEAASITTDDLKGVDSKTTEKKRDAGKQPPKGGANTSAAPGGEAQAPQALDATIYEDRSYTLPLSIKENGKVVQLEVAPPTPMVAKGGGAIRAGGLGGLPSAGTKAAEDALRTMRGSSFGTDPRREQKDRDARRGANRSAANGDIEVDMAFDIDADSQTVATHMKTIIVPQVAQRRNVVAVFSGYKGTNTSATMEAVLHTAMESLKGVVVSVAEAQNEALSMSADLPPTRREVAARALAKMKSQGMATTPTGRRGGDFPSTLTNVRSTGGEDADGSPPARGGNESSALEHSAILPTATGGSPQANKSQSRMSARSRGGGRRSPTRAGTTRPGTNMTQYSSITSPGSSKYSLLMARLPRDHSQIEVSEVSQLISRPLLPNLLDRRYELSLRGGRRKTNKNPDGSKRMKKVKKIVQVEVPGPDGGSITVEEEVEEIVTDDELISEEGDWEEEDGHHHSGGSPSGKASGKTPSKVRQRYMELRKPLGYPSWENPFARGHRPSQAFTSIPGVGLRQGVTRSLALGPKHFLTCPYPDSFDAAMKANFGISISFWICTGDGSGGPAPMPSFGLEGVMSQSMTIIGNAETLSGFGDGSVSGSMLPVGKQMTAFHFTDAHEPNFMVRALLNTNDVGTYEKGFVLVTARDAHGRYLETVFTANPCDGCWHFIDINIAPKEKTMMMSIDGKSCRSRVTSQEQPTAFDGNRKKTIFLGASPGEKDGQGTHVLSGTLMDFQVSRQGSPLMQLPLIEKGLVSLSDKTVCHTPKPRLAEVVDLPPSIDPKDIPTHDYKFPRTAPYFDGRGAHINVGSLGDFAFFENGSTIEFTFKTTSIAESMTLIGVIDSKGHHPGFGVDLNTNVTGAFQRYSVCVWVADYAGNVIRCVADLSEAFDDRWHSVSIRLTDMFSGKFKFRLDNRPVESSTAVTQTPPTQFIRYEDFVTIGCLNDRGKAQTRCFRGSLKSMRLTKHRDTPTGSEVLVFADWAFIEGPRSPIIFDQSGNGHNGVLVPSGGSKEFQWFVVSGDEEADADDDLGDQRMTVNRHDNNAVSVAVIAIVTRVDPKSGRCFEVLEDLVNNVTLKELEVVPLAGFNHRVRRDDPRCFKTIPERCFRPVTPVDYQAIIRKALRGAYGNHSSYALPQDQEGGKGAAEAAGETADAAGKSADASGRRGSNACSSLSEAEQLKSHKIIVLRLGDAMFTCVDLATYTKTEKARLLVTPNQISWTDVNCTSGVANKINNNINASLNAFDKLLVTVGQHPQLYKRSTLLNPATPTQYDNFLTNIVAFHMVASPELSNLHYFQHLHSRSSRDEALYSLLLSGAMQSVDNEHAGIMIQKVSRQKTAKDLFKEKSHQKMEADARNERARMLRKQYPEEVLEKKKKIALIVSCLDFPYDKHMPNDMSRYQYNDVKTITRLFEELKYTTIEVLLDPSLNSFKKALVAKKEQQKKDNAQLVVYFMGTGMIDCYHMPPTPAQCRLYLEEEELDVRRNNILAEQQGEWLSLYEDHWFGMQSRYDAEVAAFEDLVAKNSSKKKKKKPAKGAADLGPFPPKPLPTPCDMGEILAEFASWRTKIAPNVGSPINPPSKTLDGEGGIAGDQTYATFGDASAEQGTQLPCEKGDIFEGLLKALRRRSHIPETDCGLTGRPVVERVVATEGGEASPAATTGIASDWGDNLSEQEEEASDDGSRSKDQGANDQDDLVPGLPPDFERRRSVAVSTGSQKLNVDGQTRGNSISEIHPSDAPKPKSLKPKTKITTRYNRQQYFCLADTSVPIVPENTITLDEVKRLVIGERFGVRGNHSILIYDCVSIPSRSQRKTSGGAPYGGFGGIVAATGESLHVDYRRAQILLLTYYIKKTLIGAAVECVRIGRHDPPSIVTVETAFQYLGSKFEVSTGKCPARQVMTNWHGEYVGDCYLAPTLLTTKNERRQQKTTLAAKRSMVRLLFKWNGIHGAEFKAALQFELSKICRNATAAQCELKRVQVLDHVSVTLKSPHPITLESMGKPVDDTDMDEGDHSAHAQTGARRKSSLVKKRLPLKVPQQAKANPTLPSLRCAADYNTFVHNPVAARRIRSDLEAYFQDDSSRLRCPKFTYRICAGHPPTVAMTFLDSSLYEVKRSTADDDDDASSKLSGADAQKEKARIFAEKVSARAADTEAYVMGAISLLTRSNTRVAGLQPTSVTSYIEAYVSLNDDDIQRLERASRRGVLLVHGDAIIVSVAALDDGQLAEFEEVDRLLQLDEARKNQEGKVKLAKETEVRKKAEDERKRLKDITTNLNNTLQQIKMSNKLTAEDVEQLFSVPVPEVLASVLEGLAGICSKATVPLLTSKEIGVIRKLELIVRTPPTPTPDEELQEQVLGAAHAVPKQVDARQLRNYKVVSGMWKVISALAQCDVPLAETHPRLFPALITATFAYFPAATISSVPFLKNVISSISAGGMEERNELLVPCGNIVAIAPTIGSIMRPKYDFVDSDSAPGISPSQFELQYGTKHFRHIFSRYLAPNWPTLQCSGDLKDEVEQLIVECVPCTVNDLLECIDPTYLPESQAEHQELGFEQQTRAEQETRGRLQKFKEIVSGPTPTSRGSISSSPQRRMSITAAEALGKPPVTSLAEKAAQETQRKRREKLPPSCKFPRALIERELITRCKKMKVSIAVVAKLLQLCKDDLAISEMTSDTVNSDADSPRALVLESRVNMPGKKRSLVLLSSLIHTLGSGTFDTVLSVHSRVHDMALEKYRSEVEKYRDQLAEYTEWVTTKGKKSSRGSTAPPPNPPVAPAPPPTIAGTHTLPILDTTMLEPHLDTIGSGSEQREKFLAVLYVYADVVEFLDSPTSPNVWSREMLDVCGPAIVSAGKSLEKLRRRLLRMYSSDPVAVQLLGGAMPPEPHQEVVDAQSFIAPSPPVVKGR